MSAIATTGHVLRSRAARTIARGRVSRRRRNAAQALESTLEPMIAMRHGLRTWPRVPKSNRAVVVEPLAEIVALLRDPDALVSDDASGRVMAFATHPTSPIHGQYPNRAGFAAWSLLAELRGHAGCN
jgi:hypothetical protein